MTITMAHMHSYVSHTEHTVSYLQYNLFTKLQFSL